MAPQIISPFDPAARIRLRRMGLLTEEDQVSTNAIEAISILQAGMLFSQILDSCGDWKGTLSVCRRITAQAAQVKERQVLLIDRRIREIFRLRFYCKTHNGCLLEHMEENEHE